MSAKRSPSWFSEGILFVGNWEPLSFRRRAGFARTNEAELYDIEHQEESVRILKENGVNLIVTHYHKGFGLRAEANDLEYTKQLARLAHTYGMRIGVYIRFDSVGIETFPDEYPDALSWRNRDATGQIDTYGAQDFRHIICLSHPEYIGHLENLIRTAVEEVQVDLFHFDGFRWGSRTPCHCLKCKEAFQDFLSRRYPDPEARIERFGHHRLETLEPPVRSVMTYPDRIVDPLHQEWMLFRCERLAEIHRHLSSYIKSFSQDIAIEINSHVPVDWNGPLRMGISLPDIADQNDAMWTESRNEPRIDPSGAIIHRVREFRYAEAMGSVCFCYLKGTETRQLERSFAETLAFNAGHGPMVGSPALPSDPYFPLVQKWASFYRDHPDLFLNTKSMAEIAVLRHDRTMTFNSGRPYDAAHGVEQLLIENNVPYRTVFSRDLPTLNHETKLLILPDAACLSEDEATLILNYVRGGGGAFITGDTSLYDEHNRRRPDYLLRPLIGPEIQTPTETFSSFHFEAIDDRESAVTGLLRQHYGAGRAVYTTEWIGKTPWQPPSPPTVWLKAIAWAAGSLSVEFETPRGVLCEARLTRESPARPIFHLVNLTEQTFSRNITIRVSKSVSSAKNVTAVAPNQESEKLLTHDLGDYLEIVVPRLERYLVIS